MMTELQLLIDPEFAHFAAPELRPDSTEYLSRKPYQHDSFAERTIFSASTSAAAREEGYSQTPYIPSSRERLAMRRAQHVENLRLKAEHFIEQLTAIAFFDIRNLFDDEGNPLPLSELDDYTAAAISGVEVQRLGNKDGFAQVLKYKINDKHKALETLMDRLDIKLVADDGKELKKLSKTEKARRLLMIIQEGIREKENSKALSV